MLAFFSLLLTIVCCINWLSIGLLQFDFVAGIFGSQSSIISRIIYVIIGAAAIMLTVQLIKEKGYLHISFKKKEKQMQPNVAPTESGKDMSKQFDNNKDDE